MHKKHQLLYFGGEILRLHIYKKNVLNDTLKKCIIVKL